MSLFPKPCMLDERYIHETFKAHGKKHVRMDLARSLGKPLSNFEIHSWSCKGFLVGL